MVGTRLAVAVLALGAMASACTSDLECSLNGVCTGGVCKCDPMWNGTACETVMFEPLTWPSGYGTYGEPGSPQLVTTWGGNIIDGGDGQFHMYVSRMTNNCPLADWGKNSRIDHAVASNWSGPFTFKDVAIPTWSHNAAPVALKDGSYAIFHIGDGTGSPDGGANCTGSGEADWSSGLGTAPRAAASGSTIHVSKSLDGPWTPLPNSLGHCNNPAPWVHPNGTVFILCGSSMMSTEDIGGTWKQVATISHTNGPVGHYEDPFLWTDKRGNFHLFYHVYTLDKVDECWNSTVSAHAFSPDGFNWTAYPVPPYGTEVQVADGEYFTVATRERPKLFFDKQQNPVALLNGACSKNACPGVAPCVNCKYPYWDYTLVAPLRTSA